MKINVNAYHSKDMKNPVQLEMKHGATSLITVKSPDKESDNEDSVGVIEINSTTAILAVADGAGGYRGGSKASKLAIEALVQMIENADHKKANYRTAILDAFEVANKNIADLGIGAATTFSVAEIDKGFVRFYHVGDSPMILVGQKGKLKMKTMPHSPVGYAVAAGVMDQKQALESDESHIVSNLVGLEGMYIEISSPIPFAAKDSLLLASDGLSDNILLDKILDFLRKGEMNESLQDLAKSCQTKMKDESENNPGHPDDMSILIYRPSDSK